MTQSAKDEISGNLHEFKGTVKEKVGQVTHNPNLTAEGQMKNSQAKSKRKSGQIENVIGEKKSNELAHRQHHALRGGQTATTPHRRAGRRS
jgi:uncharacterized protein YjbJ (UPF0337 family)